MKGAWRDTRGTVPDLDAQIHGLEVGDEIEISGFFGRAVREQDGSFLCENGCQIDVVVRESVQGGFCTLFGNIQRPPIWPKRQVINDL